jgi:hypothetical protein
MGEPAPHSHTSLLGAPVAAETALIVTLQAHWTGTRPSDIHQINKILASEPLSMPMGATLSIITGAQYMKLIAEFLLFQGVDLIFRRRPQWDINTITIRVSINGAQP